MNRREFLLGGPIFLPLIFGQDNQQKITVDWELARPEFFPFTITSAERPLPVSRLQEVAGSETEEMAIIERIFDYYQSNDFFNNEPDLERRATLFCMYIVHISHFYGNGGPVANTWLEYLSRTLSECASLCKFQSQLLTRFNVPWRHIIISSGFHGWIECKIGNRWEIFDSTINTWINQPAIELLNGRARIYHNFYSPWYDTSLPEARQCIAGRMEPLLFTPGTLRSHLIGLGIYYHVPVEMIVIVK